MLYVVDANGISTNPESSIYSSAFAVLSREIKTRNKHKKIMHTNKIDIVFLLFNIVILIKSCHGTSDHKRRQNAP